MHEHNTQRETEILSLTRSLSPQRREIVYKTILLLAERKNGTPLLSEQERTEARAIVLPELERLRAEGHPQIELEKILGALPVATPAKKIIREREATDTEEQLARV